MLSVAEILKLEVLRSADAVVVAGEQGLNRPVRWVHVSELPDIAHLLSGGELLLTTGMGIARDPGAQRRFIRELADAGCAGVVIELLRTYREPPHALVQEAERHGLPLIGLRREARFVEITERVHVAIINEQYGLLVKADGIAREFTGLALQGTTLRAVLERLSRVVENPVVLEDGAHQIVDYAAHGLAVEEVLEGWERHSRSGHDDSTAAVHETPTAPGCAWIAIWLREELWGRLHVLQMGRQLDEIDRLALDRAAAAVGIALLSERDAAHVADDARRSLISDVISGHIGSPEELGHRARALGAEMNGKQLAALVIGFASIDGNGGAHRDRGRLGIAALEEIRRSVRNARATVVPAVVGNQVFAIIGLKEEDDDEQALLAIAKAACAACEREAPDVVTVAGVSRSFEPGAVRRVFEEADEALRYGLRLGVGGTYRYADLGIHHLLVRLRGGPELAGFVESELRPLLDHDARSATPLLPTLRAYLAAGGNKSAAARQLFIERRTLYRRLRRISDLLAIADDDHQRWLRLAVAVQGLDVLRERPPPT